MGPDWPMADPEALPPVVGEKYTALPPTRTPAMKVATVRARSMIRSIAREGRVSGVRGGSGGQAGALEEDRELTLGEQGHEAGGSVAAQRSELNPRVADPGLGPGCLHPVR